MKDVGMNTGSQLAQFFMGTESTKNAIDVLKQQHREVKDLFKKFAEEKQSATRRKLLSQIILELKVHSQIEEEIVYPVLAKEDEQQTDEALTEHDLVKYMIRELTSTNPKGAELAAKVKVLNELVKHHIKEEESTALPELKKAEGINLEEMGMRLEERTKQLKRRQSLRKRSRSSTKRKKSA